MALSIARQTNLSVVNKLFGIKKSSKSKSNTFFTPLNFRDMFSSTSSTNQILQQIVQKMQGAISGQPNIAGLTTQLLTSSSTTRPTRLGMQTETFEPSQQQIDSAINAMGGREQVNKWAVDGKTKVSIDGRKAVVTLDEKAAKADANLSDQEKAAKSLARFGLDAARLDDDIDVLKNDLKSAAAKATSESPHLASAIEYALEDAFAKVQQYQLSNGGGSETSQAAADMEAAYQKQRKTNLQQAEDVAGKLGLDDSARWGVDSLAEDLAVFGMDLSAIGKDARGLAEEIRTKAKDMLADLDKRYVGTEEEYKTQRNRITGSSSRLIAGLEGGAVSSFDVNASWSTSQVTVSVGGVAVNASKLVAMGNIVVDPLVLDLNGDGIDLSSAEDGVEFDMNGDGQKTGMGFIRGDDAFLFMDTHGDGVVHDGTQLFGNSGGYANGFEMLAQYDDNGDGVIDENDAIYDKLRVWQEKTEDGVCEADETMSLREAGIKSISLGYENTREDDGKGNLVGQKGSFTRDDGSEGLTADVWLRERAAAQQKS